MQSLQPTTNSSLNTCARDILDNVPPVIWFIREQVRSSKSKRLTLPQFRALMIVRRSPSVSLSLLADHLGGSLPSASRLVAGMVAKGFLVRKEHLDDRRQLALVLTPLGTETLEKCISCTQNHMEDILRSRTPAELATMIEAMKLFRQIFGPLDHFSIEAGARRAPVRAKSPGRLKRTVASSGM